MEAPQEQSQGDEVNGSQDSREQPAADSALTTPQPDQPAQPEVARQDDAPDAEQDAQPVQDQSAPEPYAPKRLPLENAGRDQVADEEQRQAEVQAQRDEHNERTGGGE